MKTRERGFSLLEVMVALAILASALGVLMRMSSVDVRNAHKAKMLTVATGLARAKMYDLEELLLKEGFKDTQQCDKGSFKDDQRPEFTFEYCIDPVELPEAQDIAAEKSAKGQAAAGGAAKDDKGSAGSSGSGGSPTSMVQMYFPLVKNVLEKAIRKVTLTVKWQIGNHEQKLDVICFFTATKPIADAAKGVPQLPTGGGK